MSKHDTEIYLSNGAVLKFHSSDLTISRNQFTNQITEMNWKREGGRELISIDISQISAVISIDYPKRRLIKIKNLFKRRKGAK